VKAPRCDPVKNECGCATNMDCRYSTGACDPLTHQCLVGCSSLSACGQFFFAPICDLTRGVCVECATNTDCKGKAVLTTPIELCSAGFCVECSTESDCADTKRHCLVEKGLCVDCLRAEHCQQGEQCFNQRCVPTSTSTPTPTPTP